MGLWLWTLRREWGVEGTLSERFFCSDSPVAGRVTLSGDEAKHLARVRRLNVGDEVELFDGQSDRAYRAEVLAIGAREVELAVREKGIEGREPPIDLTLATAIPKGERFDWLVEKAVEVGVSRLVPVQSRRSVVDPRPAKLDRQRRAVIEASKQCGRNRLMVVGESQRFADYLAEESAAVRLIAHPGGRQVGEWPVIEPGARAALAIGPEGGWTDDEVETASAGGWVPVRLGRTILRVETAAVVGSALVLARS